MNQIFSNRKESTFPNHCHHEQDLTLVTGTVHKDVNNLNIVNGLPVYGLQTYSPPVLLSMWQLLENVLAGA